MGHFHKGCGCPKQQVVHPTKHNCVHHCTQSEVEHIHPSHTTVMNHHTQVNKHVYPHSTSVQNTAGSVDVYGGSFQTPPRPGMGPGGQVAGAMTPGYGAGMGAGGGQVAGTMAPGYGAGYGHGMGAGYGGGHVAGATKPGHGHGHHHHHGAKHWNKKDKWC